MINADTRLTLRESSAIMARTLGLIASALLACSAVLQGVAAAQRWLFVDVADLAPDRTIEDHLFDYVLPADPWVSVGSAAALFGLGYLLIAVALVALGVACQRVGAKASAALVVAALTATPFALLGVRALISGASGFASALQHLVLSYGALILGAAQTVRLLLFAVIVVRRSWLWSVGLILLIGATLIGYIVALFYIAPAVTGYQSYDTTPWTEAVLAVLTALSALAVAGGSVTLRDSRLRLTGH